MGKRLTVIVLSIFLLLVLSACGNSESSPDDTESSVQQMQTTKEEPTDEAVNKSGEETAVEHKILVAYFSCTGTTESLRFGGGTEKDTIEEWLTDVGLR